MLILFGEAIMVVLAAAAIGLACGWFFDAK